MKFRIVAFVYLLIGIIALESVTFAQPQSGKRMTGNPSLRFERPELSLVLWRTRKYELIYESF